MGLERIAYKPPQDCKPGEICATEGNNQVRWRYEGRDLGTRDGIFEVHLPDQYLWQSTVVTIDANDGRVWFIRDLIHEALGRVRYEETKGKK